VLGGFGGAPQMGLTGWAQEGLPVERTADPARDYAVAAEEGRRGPLIRDRTRLPHWERRLASVSTNRVARPFEWGTEWLAAKRSRAGIRGRRCRPGAKRRSRERRVLRVEPARDYALDGDSLTFTSAIDTPHPRTTRPRALLSRRVAKGAPRASRAAAVELRCGRARRPVPAAEPLRLSALRLSLPYHDARMPPELTRADYIVSANVGRTAQVCRRRSRTRGRRSPGCTRRATSRSAFSAPASARACRC
jgi:hypothetical protein